MSDSHKLLSELRQKVQEARAKLEEEENALRIVERMLGVAPEVSVTAPITSTPTAATPQQAGPTGTIVENVEEARKAFVGKEYKASDIFFHLELLGKAPSNVSRVSSILMKLSRRGEIQVIVQGKGKSPSVYKENEEVSFCR